MTAKPFTEAQQRRAVPIIKRMSQVNIWLYRRTGGRLGGRFLRGAPVCLLTTVGRRSGQLRTVPLLYLRDGDDVVIVASMGGMPKHPVWYLNLLDDPHVTVEIRRDVLSMEARTASPQEKAALWPRLVEMYKDYDSYQERTDREIPVVICSPNV